MTRPVRARYNGICRSCCEPIIPGDLVIPGRPGWRHHLCLKAGEVAPEPGLSGSDLSEYVDLRSSAAERDRKLVRSLTGSPGE